MIEGLLIINVVLGIIAVIQRQVTIMYLSAKYFKGGNRNAKRKEKVAGV